MLHGRDCVLQTVKKLLQSNVSFVTLLLQHLAFQVVNFLKYLFTSFNNLTNFCSVFFLIFYNFRKAEKQNLWELKVEN